MNHASGKASNAVLAKARALYGRRLRAEDYRRLTDCHTMTELANESPAAVRQHAGRGKPHLRPPRPAGEPAAAKPVRTLRQPVPV